MKFNPSKADPCIWLRKAPTLWCYECLSVYVDDLCIVSESPSAVIDIFKTKYRLKVKGDGNYTTWVLIILKTPMELLLANLENTLIS